MRRSRECRIWHAHAVGSRNDARLLAIDTRQIRQRRAQRLGRRGISYTAGESVGVHPNGTGRRDVRRDVSDVADRRVSYWR